MESQREITNGNANLITEIHLIPIKKIAIMFLMDLGEPYNSTSINALR